MSLINQVLNDLEQRGTAAVRTDTVRAVPPSSGGLRRWVVWAVALAILAAALAGIGWKMRQHVPAPPPAKPPIVSKPKAISQKPMPQPLSASRPASAVTAVAGASEVAAAPALNLSFELSSIPLPSATPQQHVPAKPHKMHRKPHSAAVVKKLKTPPTEMEAQAGYGGPPIKHVSPQQQAQDEYGQALALIQQGRKSEAIPHLETTLQLDPGQTAARRTLAGLLLESRRDAEAERVLQKGLRHDPRQPGMAMLLARLQVQRGAMQQALQTLNTTMPYADQSGNYHAFLAAVLQRLNRNKEAIIHYQIALHLAPRSAVWWMGLGISFQAVGDNEDARDAFRRAAGLHKLNPQLQAFVEQHLKELQPAK